MRAQPSYSGLSIEAKKDGSSVFFKFACQGIRTRLDRSDKNVGRVGEDHIYAPIKQTICEFRVINRVTAKCQARILDPLHLRLILQRAIEMKGLELILLAKSQPIIGKFNTGQSHRYIGHEMTNRFNESSIK